MTTLRTAAQQALEAMTSFESGTNGLYEGEFSAEIAALKAALAEPVQEPDLSRCPQCGGPADNGHDLSIPPNPYFCTKCMAEPQEPVAWRYSVQPQVLGASYWAFSETKDVPDAQPLYTTPPQRKPLTEEEIECLYITAKTPMAFARSIEQAHGITS